MGFISVFDGLMVVFYGLTAGDGVHYWTITTLLLRIENQPSCIYFQIGSQFEVVRDGCNHFDLYLTYGIWACMCYVRFSFLVVISKFLEARDAKLSIVVAGCGRRSFVVIWVFRENCIKTNVKSGSLYMWRRNEDFIAESDAIGWFCSTTCYFVYRW